MSAPVVASVDNCSAFAVVFDEQPCANGVCVVANASGGGEEEGAALYMACSCSPGWSGFGDGRVGPYETSCDIFVPVVQALWGLEVALALVALGYCVSSLAGLNPELRSILRREFRFQVVWLGNILVCLCAGVVRMTNVTARSFCRDTFTTVLAVFFFLFLLVALLEGIIVFLLVTIENYARASGMSTYEKGRLIWRTEGGLFFIGAIGVALAGVFPGCIADADCTLAEAAYKTGLFRYALLCGLGVYFVVFSIGLHAVLQPVRRMLENAEKGNPIISTTLRNVRIIQRLGPGCGLFLGLAAASVGPIPYLARKVAYFTPFVYVGGLLVSLASVRSVRDLLGRTSHSSNTEDGSRSGGLHSGDSGGGRRHAGHVTSPKKAGGRVAHASENAITVRQSSLAPSTVVSKEIGDLGGSFTGLAGSVVHEAQSEAEEDREASLEGAFT